MACQLQKIKWSRRNNYMNKQIVDVSNLVDAIENSMVSQDK